MINRSVWVVLCTLLSFTAVAQQQGEDKIRFGDYQKFGPQNTTVAQIIKAHKFTTFDKNCKVVGFDIYGMVPGKEYIGPYHSDNNKLTESQVNYIKSLYHGGNLWINHIKVKCADGTEYEIGKDNTEFSIYYFTIQ